MPQHGTKCGKRLSKSPGLNRRFAPVLISLSAVLLGAAALLVAFVLPGTRTASHGPQPALAVDVTDGEVHLPISRVRGGSAKFFVLQHGPRAGTRFFVVEEPPNRYVVAIDDCGICEVKRGFRQVGEMVVCNYCDQSFAIASLGRNASRCAPIPVPAKIKTDHVVIAARDLHARSGGASEQIGPL